MGIGSRDFLPASAPQAFGAQPVTQFLQCLVTFRPRTALSLLDRNTYGANTSEFFQLKKKNHMFDTYGPQLGLMLAVWIMIE